MRVLRISHSAVVEGWRGRERALRKRGADVSLLSAQRFGEGGALVELAPRPGEHVTGVATMGSHPALFVYDPRPIWRALGEEWDVIDIHEEPFALSTAEILLLRALRRRRTPFVLYTAQNLPKRYPMPFRWVERWVLRHASGISACNADAAAIVVAKGFPGVPHVIPLGIDPSEFRPADVAEAVEPLVVDEPAEGTGPQIIVGFLGRLVPEKGLFVLLDAVVREPRLRVRIVGSGPLATELPLRAASLGIADRVDLLPALPSGRVADFYRSVDVLAIPSLPTAQWTEQFGRVAVEAMASGVPVVSSDAGALPEVVGGAGIVVSRGDAGALAAALLDAAGPRRQELRAAGFARARECTWDAVAEEYLDLYATVIRAPSATARPVEVVVVAYGSADLLRGALEPVVGLPVTVVDNSSLPELRELCNELGIRYLDAEGNLGFGAGVNLALSARLVPEADVLLLNPDARIEPDQIALLQRRLRERPDIASVGASQVDGTGHPARVEWPFPSPLNAWLEAVGLARLQRGPHFAIGSVLLLRAEALTQVGWFDDRFFLYAEETDWAYRAHLLGWRHGVVTDAAAMHIGAGTSTDDRLRTVRFHASQERFYRKHYGALGWQLARVGLWVGAFARSVALSGERGRAARARADLLRHGPMRVAARAEATR